MIVASVSKTYRAVLENKSLLSALQIRSAKQPQLLTLFIRLPAVNA